MGKHPIFHHIEPRSSACRNKENPGVFSSSTKGWRWMEWAYHHFFLLYTLLQGLLHDLSSRHSDFKVSTSASIFLLFLSSSKLQMTQVIPLRTLPTSATSSRQRYLFAQFSKHPVRIACQSFLGRNCLMKRKGCILLFLTHKEEELIVSMNPAFLKRPNSKKTLFLLIWKEKVRWWLVVIILSLGMCYKIGYVTSNSGMLM